MFENEVQARIKERFARKRQQMEEKIEKVREKIADFEQEHLELEAKLEALEERLSALDEGELDKRLRLEAERERLLVRQERLRWKQEMQEARIETLREVQESLEASLQPRGVTFTGDWPSEPEPERETDRLKILEMVAEGTISAEEAARLLEAAEKGARTREVMSGERNPRVLRVRVSDLHSGTRRVNITLPLGLIRTALKRRKGRGTDINVGGINLDADELETLLNSGVLGHIVDVVDEEDGERVEVLIE